MSTPTGGASRRRRIAGERRRPEETTEVARTDPALPAAAPTPPAPPAGEPPAAATRPRKPGSWLAFGLAAALALVLVAAALVMGLGTWDYREIRDAHADQAAGDAALSSAERAAAAVLSYKYDSLDADLASATKFLTPAYRKTFTDTFDTYVRPNAPKLRATVTAKVLASAVVTADRTHAQILVYVDQTSVTTANSGRPQLALNRTTFDMVKRDGSWLVSNFSSY